MKLISTGAVLLGSAISTFGCVAEPVASVDLDFDVAMETMDAPQGLNGGDGVCLLNPVTRTSLVDLKRDSLYEHPTGYLRPLAVGAGCDARQIMHYIVQCALPVGTSITDADGSTVHSGNFGFAPGWLYGDLTNTKDQEWMTACLLQHINAFQVHVPIMLSGDNSVLNPPPGFNPADYPFKESTAWGNLFTSTTSEVYVCHESDLGGLCRADARLHLSWRVCDTGGNCGGGFVSRGDCAQVCTLDINGLWICDGKKTTLRISTATNDATGVYGNSCQNVP